MSPPPYTPKVDVEGSHYFPPPYSKHPLPHMLRTGLISIGFLAILSVGSTLSLISFIAWRTVHWRRYHRTFLGYNQYIILVLNLLLADLQQGLAYLVSFHWIRKNAILAPTATCFVQGWLLHSGDVSSGFFVLLIAVHTYSAAVHGRRVGHKLFAAVVIGTWILAYSLTGIGVGLHGSRYFVRAGAWCWVSEAYEDDRLAFHYVWVFFVQFSTVVIYIATFITLRRKMSQLFVGIPGYNRPNMASVKAVNRITKLMALYPCVYVVLTLPLSAGRMWSMAHQGRPYSDEYALFAGALLTSCGWVDTLLYTLTRKRLLKDTMPSGHSGRTTSENEASGGISCTRTVTVETELALNTFPSCTSTKVQHERSRIDSKSAIAGA